MDLQFYIGKALFMFPRKEVLDAQDGSWSIILQGAGPCTQWMQNHTMADIGPPASPHEATSILLSFNLDSSHGVWASAHTLHQHKLA